MKKILYVAPLFALLIACARKSMPGTVSSLTASAVAQPSVNPIMKGLTTNPLVRIRIYVPEAAGQVSYQSIECSLNAGVNSIEKLQVFFTDTEPLFSTSSSIAQVQPTTSSFNIPINIQLKPGLHYLWIGGTLKDDADINSTIKFVARGLANDKGGLLKIEQENEAYTWPVGYAVRKAGDDGVNSYRIPGIATTNKGTLLSVYDIRYNNSRDLPANIDVGLSRSTDGGNTWQPMKIIMDMGAPHENNGVGDPAILFDPVNNRIWVAALWSKGNRSIAGSMPGLSPDTTGQFVVVSSDDDGLTWSTPKSITPQVKNPAWHLFFNGPGMGIAMHDGKLVFAAQYWDEKKMPWSTIIYSEDEGKTWKGNIKGPKANTTESQVVETTPGTLMLNMRDNRGGFRSVAVTHDMGKTWTEHPTSYSALPDPVCMGSIIKAKVKVKGVLKDVLFFSNPNTTSGRYNLTIKASLDLGETWLPGHQLLIDERQSFGYSCLSIVDDETVGLLYEGVRDLYFVKVPVNQILK